MVISGAIYLFGTFAVYGQIGLWEVKTVMVGERNLTPVAKWFRFNSNNTFESGNGWTQNSAGDWSLDTSKRHLTLYEKIALSEGNDPYVFIFKDDKMTWTRTEFGEEVTVKLEKIDEIPRAPTDKVQGLWDFEMVVEDGQDISSTHDPDSNRIIFIRPDRRFRDEHGPKGLKQGYWQMNMHQPLMTVIPEDRNQNPEVWEVQFGPDQMIWLGKSDNNQNITITFRRLKNFPED